MWYPVSLKIVNLFSYEESYFEFVNNKLTLVYGENKTDPNVISNRSGKTSILDVITICFIGEPLRDIKKNEIVRNGEKEGQAIFILENKVLNKKIEIVRDIHSTKPNNAIIYEDGVLNTRLKDLEVKYTDQYILELLGISKDDLINYYLISKDSYQSFFTNGDTAKKQIINRFSKADMIDPVDPLIKADVDVIEVDINKLQNQLNTNKGILEHLDEEINKDKLESSIETTRKITIEAFQVKVDENEKLCLELPDLIEAKEKELNDQQVVVETAAKSVERLEKDKEVINFSIDKLEKEVRKIDTEEEELEETYVPKFDVVQSKIKECQEKIKSENTLIVEYNKKITSIDAVLAGLIECPKCEHKFILKDKTFDIKKAEKEKNDVQCQKEESIDNVLLLEDDIKNYNTEIQELHDVLKKENEVFVAKKADIKLKIKEQKTQLDIASKNVSEANTNLNNESKKIGPLQRELDQLNENADHYVAQIDLYTEKIKEETDRVYPETTSDTQEKIDKLKEQNEALQVDIDKKVEEKNLLLEWQVRFKQFKSFLANSSISAIQEMTNFFLGKMRTNLTVQINGYRELSNKKLKEEIETLVCRDGLNGERINKFSGEEKAEVNLAAVLAFQKIINLSSESGGLNLLFIDEILESADQVALPNIVKALVDLEQTIFLITFVDLNGIDCNKLKVEKVKGISKIVSLQ